MVAQRSGRAYTRHSLHGNSKALAHRSAKGFGGCNTFSATAYPLQQQRFAVGPVAVTKRACEKDVMERERVFLVLLRTAAVWDVKDGQLLITGNNGQLKFDRAL